MSRASTVSLVLAALIAAVAYVELRLPTETPPPPARGDAATRDLEARVAGLESEVRRLTATSPPPAGDPPPVEAPRPERPGEVRSVPAPAPPPAPVEEPEPAAEAKEKAAKRVRDFLSRLEAGAVRPEEFNGLWEILPSSGMGREAVTAFEEYVKAHPDDPNAHYGLGIALTSSFLGQDVSMMELATLSRRADEQYTRALELDDHHFGARYSKAISYVNWPAHLGKGPEAIRNFEILVERHGTDTSNPLMRQVYLSLGTQYQKVGNREKARDTFRRGVTVFPDSKELRDALSVMD
jgi:hypothetical protein